VGVDLRDGGSPLAFALLDRSSNKPCDGDRSEAQGIIAPSFEPATGYPSFAEIIERVDASVTLSSVAKRDLKSAIKRTIGTWMGRDLAATPADIPWLRKQMAEWTAARFGVSEGTFNTVRSQLNRALKVGGSASLGFDIANSKAAGSSLTKRLSATGGAIVRPPVSRENAIGCRFVCGDSWAGVRSTVSRRHRSTTP
jgi:hypothetical protein